MRNVEFYRKTWRDIHHNAARVVRGQMSHRSFCGWMRTIPGILPCSKCSRHAAQYMSAHPPERYRNAFEWAWRFHNDVNYKKQKPQMYLADARRLYGL